MPAELLVLGGDVDWNGLRAATVDCENPIAVSVYKGTVSNLDMVTHVDECAALYKEMPDGANLFMLGTLENVTSFPSQQLLPQMRRLGNLLAEAIKRKAVHEIVLIDNPSRFAEIMVNVFNGMRIATAKMRVFKTPQEAIDYINSNCVDYNDLIKKD